MRWTLWIALGACTPKPVEETDVPVDTDDTTPPEPTVPPPTDPLPTDTDPDGGGGGGGGGGGDPTDAEIRILHAAPGLPSQDMVVNGVLPPTLTDLRFLEGTPYAARAYATYTFQMLDAGRPLEEAWTTFDYELLTGRRHSIILYGPEDAPAALALLDDDLAIDPAMVRIRWTHVAPALAPTVTLIETLTGTVLTSALPYGGTVELDHLPELMQVGADTDADGVADLVFESFQRTAGEYFHILLVTEGDGTPFLLGQVPGGVTPRRELLP